ELQDRLRTIVMGDALHHEDLACLGRTLRQKQIRRNRSARKRQVGHGRIIITSADIHGDWLRAATSDLLVHPARDRPAGGALRPLAGGLLGWSHGRRAVGPAAVLHAHATLHLRPCGGHEKEQRRDGEHGGDAVKCRTLHDPKVGTATNLSTTRAGRNVAARLSLSLVPSRSPQRLATFFWRSGDGSWNCCCSVAP